ncbi:Low density lipoprotein receptor adapter protein 1 [Goodea atripinnis]|uniref:Low density lipoprotein receptor adapter protein 1 n=1 Tax=Goodea atripinnis TaxID=208336 RepID=A0ABV0N930_9TELE
MVRKHKAAAQSLMQLPYRLPPKYLLYILVVQITAQILLLVSIISYCTADKMHDKVFAYIVQSQHNETLECHAFLCSKRKMAQAVTLTVAQAFRVAFEFWQAAKEGTHGYPQRLCCDR